MAGLLDFNHGGATHPGARAIVHPGADSDEHVVLYAVVTETEEHITLDDGYTYDKRTGVVQGPAGRPTLQNCWMVTEGSTMFDSWSPTARTPHYPHPSEGSRRYSVSWDANGFPDERNHPPAPRAIIQRRDIAEKPTNHHASRRHPPQMVPQPPTISTRKPPCVPTATTCGSKNVRQDVSYPFNCKTHRSAESSQESVSTH